MKIKNWPKFQHFKDRKPPWIKLYRDLLDDDEWFALPPQSAKILVILWLLASEDDTKQGVLPSMKKIAFRTRTPETALKTVLSDLSHFLIQDDISVISERYQLGPSETETYKAETEAYKTETERDSRAVKTSREPKGGPTWDSYKSAYEGRYGVEPVRNRTVNSLICRVVDKLGPRESPCVAAFYLTHPNSFYVQKGHPVNLLLADAEKLRTEWATNHLMTHTQAVNGDRLAAKGQMWQRLLEKDAAKTKEGV